MASQGVAAANSRLAQMQMRFQQKQMQEREQRRLEMTDDSSAMSESSMGAKSIGNGKVRQMFDERRRGAGIDRGYPLKPISSTARALEGATRHMPGADSVSVERTRKPPPVPPKKRSSSQAPATNGYTALTSRGKLSTSSNNNSTTQTISKGFSSLSLGDARSRNTRQVIGDRNNNHNDNSSKAIASEDNYARSKSSNGIKLNPLVTRKSPQVTKSRQSPPSGATKQTPRTTTTTVAAKQRSGRKSPDTPASATTVKTGPKRTAGNMSSHSAGGRHSQSQDSGPPPSGMGTCRFCSRHFYTERLAKHEVICEKMVQTKRKIFDAARHRIRGTDAEKYLKKNTGRTNAHVQKPSYTSAAAASGLTVSPNSALKKNNWRKKHEEFIAAIRAAKQVQAHLARGGKLSDLPPPPPSENPDYIQCPHCMRRFNQAAAERHIPRCATMIHNKPKSSQQNVANRRR